MPALRTADGPPAEFPLHVLREYSLLADGERGVLVGPRGDFTWMCAPRWDDDAVFSTLLDGVGMYSLTPFERPFVWGGFYEPGSLIWHSRWVTGSQYLESREALAFPGDPHSAVVLRRVLAVDGCTRVRVVLDPRAGFGDHRMTELTCRDGVWAARCGPLFLRWSGAPEAHVRSDGALEVTLSVEAGDVHDLVLELSDRPLADEPVNARRAWSGTAEAWRRAVPPISGTVADRDARQAYAVLRGLTSSEGGMVAAATMRLPERAEQGRNYDYRYAWIRDQCYAGQAVAACGEHRLLDDAVRFVADRLLDDGPELKPAYTVAGGAVPDERELGIEGYPGGAAKVGNWVNKQFQLDAFGEALLLFAAAAGHDRLGRRALARGGSRRRGDRRPLARAGRRDLGTRRPTLDALPADLRRGPACDRWRTRRPGKAAQWNALADSNPRRRLGRRLPASLRTLAARAGRSEDGRRPADPGPARRAAAW